MRWFKHFTDNHRGQSVQILLDEMGYFGPFFYYLIYELCSEKLESATDVELTQDHCEFNFHQRVICSASRAKPATVRRALDAGQSCGLWSYEINSFQIKIKVPILLNLLDRRFKKPHLNRKITTSKVSLDKDTETDTDKDSDKDSDTEFKPRSIKLTKSDQDDNRKIKQSYFDAYRLRYGIEPISNAAFNAMVSNLRKKVGTDTAVELCKFYLNHPNSFYISKTHEFKFLLSDAETLRTQMLKNIPMTREAVKEFEKLNQKNIEDEKLKQLIEKNQKQLEEKNNA